MNLKLFFVKINIFSEKKDGYNWTITEFEDTPLMSSYLVALVVSDFKCKSGLAKPNASHSVNVSVCARPNAYDDLSLAYTSAVKMLEFFETYYNITYPLTKLSTFY